ncbi:MAG: hypothetical protein ACP5OP_00530 [Leptospirillia bacterium]
MRKVRPKSGRYVLFGLFWIFWAGVVVTGLSRMPHHLLRTVVLGPPVVSDDTVRGWVTPLAFKTLPSSNRSLLESLVREHPWILRASIKLLPGEGRIVRVRLKTPVAVLLPSYGLLAFQSQRPQAAPTHSSFLVDGGLVLSGESLPGAGTLPQVIVRSPLPYNVGRRLIRTIRTVQRCWKGGSNEGSWYSLNSPHEIRYYPGHGAPVLLLGTDLGCAPFRLFDSFMTKKEELVSGKSPEAVDLRFSGMLILRPVLDPPSKKPEKSDSSARS